MTYDQAVAWLRQAESSVWVDGFPQAPDKRREVLAVLEREHEEAERGRWLISQAEDYDGHACFPDVPYRNGLHDGFEAKTVREAIDAARKGVSDG